MKRHKEIFFRHLVNESIGKLRKGESTIIFSEEQYRAINKKIQCDMFYTKDGFIKVTPIN